MRNLCLFFIKIIIFFMKNKMEILHLIARWKLLTPNSARVWSALTAGAPSQTRGRNKSSYRSRSRSSRPRSRGPNETETRSRPMPNRNTITNNAFSLVQTMPYPQNYDRREFICPPIDNGLPRRSIAILNCFWKIFLPQIVAQCARIIKRQSYFPTNLCFGITVRSININNQQHIEVYLIHLHWETWQISKL